jgi:DNA-directed RNA polymerase specialized sigma24 family protein
VNAEELFREHADYLLALGRKWARWASPFDHAAGPEDVAQEVALVAVRRLPRFDPDRVPFRPWLACLARSVASEMRAKASRPIRAASAFGSAYPDGSDLFAGVIDRNAPDPAAAPAPLTDVLVPICDLGLGTGNAWVEDARTGARVRVPAAGLKLSGRALCVPAVAFDEDGEGLRRVLLPGGVAAWVRLAIR